MTNFSIMWGDIEDPKASADLAANAAFIQGGLDACAGRIVSGVYGNEGSIQRIVGQYQFPGYPYWRASGDGTATVDGAPTNGMTPTYEQFTLNRTWDGVAVDIDVRNTDHGIEYGIDLSNYSLQNGQVPSVQWFTDRWNDQNLPIRFIVFGDQKPYVALAQIANADATGLAFDFQLYTYFNMPGGDYYSGLDGAAQMTRALDALGVPAPAPQPATHEWSSFAIIDSETFSVTLRKV